jgi:UDP-2,3-diacylglucosamine pyrophosphatase LpxH
MGKTRRVFISDIHLSSQQLYDNSKKPAWYDPAKHNPRLLGFLDKYVLKNKDRIKDLILLGDVFNTWVCPANKFPPTYDEIFSANKSVINKLKEIMKAGIDLFYLNGNHDFDLKSDTIKKHLKGIKVVNYYRSGRIHAEHGNRFDIYNKPDFITDPAYGRPIGYFISRLVTSINAQGYGLLDLPSYLDDLLEAAVTPQNIYSTIIEGLAERAGMTDEDAVFMPGKQKIKIHRIKDRYDKLSEIYNLGQLINDLYQRRYLNAPADRLCQRHDYNVVVFGHTHNATIDKDFFLVEDRIYANSGSWCKKNAYAVEINKTPDPSEPTQVFLHKVDKKGEIKDTKQEEV